MKRSRLVLVVILVAVAALCIPLWVNEGPLWRWVMLERVDVETFSSGRGWMIARRWTNPQIQYGRKVLWDPKTGFKKLDQYYYSGREAYGTGWDQDGKVRRQFHYWFSDSGDKSETPSEPPWLWGVQDQTEPTAPWWGKE